MPTNLRFVFFHWGGWQVKDKEVLQSAAPENFWPVGQNLKKGTFLIERTFLTNAKFKRRYNGENLY